MRQLAVTALRGWVDAAGAAGQRPLLLDVREPWEVDLAAIRVDGADTVCWPVNEVPARLAELAAPPFESRPIVCICHHGVRSAQVVAFLAFAGFESVYNLAGGTDAWSVQVDPTVPRY